jgi:hypothetical protein
VLCLDDKCSLPGTLELPRASLKDLHIKQEVGSSVHCMFGVASVRKRLNLLGRLGDVTPRAVGILHVDLMSGRCPHPEIKVQCLIMVTSVVPALMLSHIQGNGRARRVCTCSTSPSTSDASVSFTGSQV